MMLYLQRELVKRGKIIRVLLSTANLQDVTVGPGTLILMLSMNGCGLEVMVDAVQRLAEEGGEFWLLTQAGGRGAALSLCAARGGGRRGTGFYLPPVCGAGFGRHAAGLLRTTETV